MKFPYVINAQRYGTRHACILTATRIQYGSCVRPDYSVKQSDIRRALQGPIGDSLHVEDPNHKGYYWRLWRLTDGTFTIGCCDFGPAATRIIRKWAGLSNRKKRVK